MMPTPTPNPLPPARYEQLLRHRFSIDGWRVEPREHRLIPKDRSSQSTDAVRLEPKVMQVLVRLTAEAGEVVSRDEIFAAVWPEQYVGEDVLSRSISELRKHFGDDPRQPRYIETIRKGGYRLVAAVDFDSETTASSPRRPSGDSPSPRRHRGVALAVTMAVGLLLAAWIVTGRASLPAAEDSPGNDPFPVRQASAEITIRPLTSYPGTEWHPALSPDGTHIAFSWSGPEDGDLDVYVRAVDGEAPRRLSWSAEDELAPVFSPDGSRIVFARGGHESWQLCEIAIDVALDPDQMPRVMTSGSAGRPTDLAWSPDGRVLALPWRARDGEPFRIALVDVATAERQLVSRPPIGTYGDLAPAFSSDGRRLAFIRARIYGIQDVFVLDLGGVAARRLTHDQGKVLGVTWTSNEHLVVASNRGGIFELWRLPVGGGEPTRLGVAGTDVFDPTSSRRGDRLVVQRLETQVDIYRLPLRSRDASPESLRPLISSSRWDASPHVSADARRLAFASNRSGSPEIWISHADGSEPRPLTDFGGPLTNYPRWSPNGEWIVFESRRQGSADIYLIATNEGAKPRRLTDAASDEMVPNWSRDGSSIYLTSNRSGSWEIWKMPFAGGEPRQMTRGGGMRALESPDGKTLYFSRFSEGGLWRMPAVGGEVEQVVDGPPKGFWGSWELTGSGQTGSGQSNDSVVFLRKASNESYEVAEWRESTGRVVSHGPIRGPGSLTTWAVSPAGDWLFAPQNAMRRGDLFLIDGLISGPGGA